MSPAQIDEIPLAIDEYETPADFLINILGYDYGDPTYAVPLLMANNMDQPRARQAVAGCHASSKALDLATPLPTPDGWTTIGEIRVGDRVYTETGQTASVVQVSPIMEKPSYRVTFCTGESIITSGDHLWSAIDICHRPRLVTDWRDHWDHAIPVTTEVMARTLQENGQYRWRVPVTRPIEGDAWSLPVPPYTLGAWLGDGTTVRAEITCDGADLPHYQSVIGGRVAQSSDRAPRLVFGIRPYLDSPCHITGGVKRIPMRALRSTVADRVALLRGLMDTDGWVTRGSGVSISQIRRDLAEDIRALVVSLGWKASWREQRAVLNGVDCGPCYVVSFSPDVCPFSLPRKVAAWRSRTLQASRFTQRTIVSIEPVGVRQVACIGVDSPRHLYLAGEAMVPTHNTFTAAGIVHWWLAQSPEHWVITTAATHNQVRRTMWPQIHKAKTGAGLVYPINNLLEIGTTQENNAIGFATNDPTRFQGFHGHGLIIIDEAIGVFRELWDAVDGIRAGGDVRVLAMANPTLAQGRFYEIFSGRAGRGWLKMRISALDTPNMAGLTIEDLLRMPLYEGGPLDDNPLPFLATRRWIREMYEEHGPESPAWWSRVLARFPLQSSQALFPLSALNEANEAWEEDPGTEVYAGLDVAGGGRDETVLYLRCEDVILGMWSWSLSDVRGEVLNVLLKYRDRLRMIFIDEVGLGYYLKLYLIDEFGEERVTGVNGAHAPSLENARRFANQKAEDHWHLRELLMTGRVTNLQDSTTITQLSALTYHPDAQNRTAVMDKKEYDRAVGGSPDRAEALIYAFKDAAESGWDGQPLVTRANARLFGITRQPW